ncbi:MAG: hypothetical protein L3J83_02400 [Proteobacteria bacterium]|nr:hypothetical protein [Pseudomonadota bacterium]
MSISLSVHAGLSFNQINNPNRGLINPTYINGKIVYLDASKKLWVNQGSLMSDTRFLVNSLPVQARDLTKADDSVLFINELDGNTLWSTDGTDLNQVSTLSYSSIRKNNANVITGNLQDSGNFVVIEGDNVLTYDIQPLTLLRDGFNPISPSVCFFDENKLIFQAYDELSASPQFYFYNSGSVSTLGFEVALDFVVSHDNQCFYRRYAQGQSKAFHVKVDDTGTVMNITNPEGAGYFDDFFVFNNERLLFLKDENGTRGLDIYSLSSDSLLPEIKFTINEPVNTGSSFNVTSYWATKDYLYIYSFTGCTFKSLVKCTPAPPDPNKLYVYDTSFNLVNKIIDSSLQNFLLKSIDGKDFLITSSVFDSLVELKEGEIAASVSSFNTNIIDVIGGENGEHFVFARDKITNKNGLFKASEQPTISSQLTGLWVSDQWQSQGLSIHTGTRADSSQYIFVSFYIYRDGQPFWLAGSDELNTGTSSQTINLAEYKGQSFLANDPNQDFEQISFGTITIQPQSCDGISVQINPVNEQPIQLDMDRIINTGFSNVCSDD